jgi:CheY-like chemotaxis protein
MLDLTDCSAGNWPSVHATLEFSGVLTPEATARKGRFCREMCRLFDRVQEGFARLDVAEKARCGLDGVAAEIFLQVDLEKNEIVLDKIFKYCVMDFHIFTELLEILQRHFPDCDLVVPSLQGYELAREIRRFLGVPQVECIFLKGDTEERLLMGDALFGASFEGILEDTQRHYEERGGVEKKRQELGPGREVSMYWRGMEGEGEVLWMQVRIALSTEYSLVGYGINNVVGK